MEIDLARARRHAKELLRAARAGAPEAVGRMRGDRSPRLADAQRAVANDLGFASWPALVAHVEGASGGDRERRSRLVHLAMTGPIANVERMLADDPALADAGLDVALVIGNDALVAAELDKNPSLVGRELPGLGAAPLACACQSAFLREDSPRAPGVQRVIERLLRSGASLRGTTILQDALDTTVTVRILLERGDLRPSDPELRDALLDARSPEVVALLLEHGASVDARGADGLTPYSRAARFRSEATMRVLAAAGGEREIDPAAEWVGAVVRGDAARAARVTAEHPGLVLRTEDLEQLPRWASAGDDEVVSRLLDAGVPIDARGADGGTALHFAGFWGRASTVETLLSHGADVEALADSPDLATPLGWTAAGSRLARGAPERIDAYLAAAKALLEAGARITAHMVEEAADELSVLLDEAAERAGILRDAGWTYAAGHGVWIRVRHRVHRYDIDDMGAAVALASRPEGWREAALRVTAERGWNINRDGVVSVPAVEGRDIDALVRGTAETSVAVYEALVDLDSAMT